MLSSYVSKSAFDLLSVFGVLSAGLVSSVVMLFFLFLMGFNYFSLFFGEPLVFFYADLSFPSFSVISGNDIPVVAVLGLY